MSFQRRRGIPAKIWKTVRQQDRRGNITAAPNGLDGPYEVTVAFIPQRSSRAEVPGQMQVNVNRIIVRHDMPDVDLWSRVEVNGKVWDVAAPPAYHHGTRRTRHLSIDLRERP